MNFLRKTLLAWLITVAWAAAAHAGIVIGGTRVIFDGGKKEAAVSINNPDTSPYLVQSWIDMPDDSAKKAPFIITPPLYRLDKGQKNVERIVLTGVLPQDRESLFWLNIKSIPSASVQENTLQIAVKTRIKLIYRPQGLKGTTPEDHAGELRWRRVGNQLIVSNPSAYIMNFNEITVDGKKLPEVSWVLPQSEATFTLPPQANGGVVKFKIINDYGGAGQSYSASL